jgi:hypothetical protein
MPRAEFGVEVRVAGEWKVEKVRDAREMLSSGRRDVTKQTSGHATYVTTAIYFRFTYGLQHLLCWFDISRLPTKVIR